LPKQHCFDQHKKKMPDDLLSNHYSSSSTFCTRKATQVASFQGHLMSHLYIKQDTTLIA